jgi:hypothetical protein
MPVPSFIGAAIMPIAMLSGANASTTQAKGQRIKPTDAIVLTTTSGAGLKPWRNNGADILPAVAIISPAAAGAMPPRMRRTNSTSPNWA